MDKLLWVLQSVLALLCISGGAYKLSMFDALQKQIAAARELPKGLWMAIGVFEVIAGLALIVPAVMKRWPGTTAQAAAAIAVESVLISALYLAYGDKAPVGYTAFMAVLAAFIAYGRFKLAPL